MSFFGKSASSNGPGLHGLLLTVSLLCAGGCAEEECPDPSLITDDIKNATGGNDGTARIHGEVIALETCDDNYCHPGRVVAMVKIDGVEADCSTVQESSKLDDGQDVPVFLPKNAPVLAVGAEMDIGCVVLGACADGCKVGPHDTPIGPCWHMEFGCRTRCYALFVEDVD